MAQKKRIALSIFETMGRSTSPFLKLWKAKNGVHCFKSGLVGPFLTRFNVSNLDTFIEKPFSVLSFHVWPALQNKCKDHGGPSEKQSDSL
jgi:hypothetical protein